ncbi:16S rRNA (cytosine(967)-C(5))-methyltransferase RsmB [Paenibacillus koleovorans]|uniref:16S rRNA (cytosine(967)-C(5))-methyltransferase RsmB n=1 Tax=Paenibacillus koleovorans TaxID=121608 RepID=UPI001FE54453
MDILTRVEQEQAYSNLLLNQTLQKQSPPLEKADAGLTTELVYGTIQRLNTLDYFLARFVAKGVAKLEPWVRSLLRLSLYQLVYLDRIPEHAVVNEAVNLAKRRGHAGISGMVNGVLRSAIRSRTELVVPTTLPAAERISLLHSYPKWMVEQWIRQFGEATAERICESNNRPPAVSVRVNRLRASREAVLQQMADAGLDARPSSIAPSGLIVESGGNMAFSTWFRDGAISIQDESSMLVAEAVDPQPGMTVLDCCAAPGGKTAHLAERMDDRGRIVACDAHEHKRRLIAEQAERLGLRSVETLTGDARELPQRFPAGAFDRVLLDAPCSGLGVIRRKPDLKWAKQPEEIEAITELQAELLDAAAWLVAPGGVLVYSTCTLAAEENGDAVLAFLERHPAFAPEPMPPALAALPGAANGQVSLLPSDYGSDGFFIARLRRKDA